MLYLHNSVNFFCCCYYTVRLNPNRHFLAVPNRSGMLYWLYKNEKSHWDIPGTERTKDPYFLVDCEANTNIVLNQILTVRIPKFFPVILVFCFVFESFECVPKYFAPHRQLSMAVVVNWTLVSGSWHPPPPPPVFPTLFSSCTFDHFFSGLFIFRAVFPAACRKEEAWVRSQMEAGPVVPIRIP